MMVIFSCTNLMNVHHLKTPTNGGLNISLDPVMGFILSYVRIVTIVLDVYLETYYLLKIFISRPAQVCTAIPEESVEAAVASRSSPAD